MATVQVDCFVGYFDAMSSIGRKDYFFDWTGFMQTGDVIATFDVTAAAGVIVGDGLTGGPAPIRQGNMIICWLSFEPTAIANEYRVYCRVTTTDGRTEQKYAILRKCA